MKAKFFSHFIKLCFFQFLFSTILFAQQISIPNSPVSFPKEVIPVNGGKIDFYAKLSGFSGGIPVGGVAPHFFLIYDGTFGYTIGFNSNDGAGNGGLVGVAGNSLRTGTGQFGGYTYSQILGAGKEGDWHHYVFQWNKNGIPGIDNGQQKIAIFIDGVLNSNRWSTIIPGTFDSFSSCPTLNLITSGNAGNISGEVAIDEFKIFDENNNLVLWNTLGSKAEIERSNVGLNGTFNATGNTHFVPGISGNATMAVPIFSIGNANCSTNCIPPKIDIERLGNLDICQTGSVFLQANGNSGNGFTYQWKRDDVDIQGANSRGYIATSTGSYTVHVINNLGCSTLSKPVTVTRSTGPCSVFCISPTYSATCVKPAKQRISPGRDLGALLSWGSSGGAKWFQVVIVDKNYATVKDTTIANIRTNQNQFKAIRGLLADGLYHWKVRSFCDDARTESSEWSCGMDFTIPFPNSSSQKDVQSPDIENANDDKLIFSKDLRILLYPNPSNGTFNVKYTSIDKGRIQLKVYDYAGQLIFTKQEQSSKGNNLYQLDLIKLGAGSYYLEIINGKDKRRQKFIIQK